MRQMSQGDEQNTVAVGARALSRRVLCGVAFPALALGLPSAAHAALTGIEVLDSPAIPVANPSHVVLIAIATAGTRMVAAGEHGVIIYSDDDGVTWRQGSVPVDVTLTCLSFASATLGWAAGHFGVVLQTRDGGASWQEQMDGIEANQLTLAAAQQAAVTDPNAPGTPTALRRAGFFMQAGPDKPFLSCLALSPREAIIFGAYRLTLMTTDAGRTWADWSLRIGYRFSCNLYAAAIIGGDIFIVAEQGLVFRSTDRGQTFPPVTSPTPVTLFGVTGTPGGNVIVFGVAGTCYRSTDRGETWTLVGIVSQDNLTTGLVLTGGAILLANESGTLFISRDDGISFTTLSGLPPMAIADMALAADHSILVVGQTGATRLAPGLITS